MSKKQLLRLPTRNNRVSAVAPTFVPTDISGLTLWLDYMQGTYTTSLMTVPSIVGGPVGGWTDLSGNDYHATELVNMPTLQDDGIEFDGVNDVLRVARMTGQFGAGFSYFVAASVADARAAGTQILWGATQATPSRQYFNQQFSSVGVFLSRISENDVNKDTTLNTFDDGTSAMFLSSATANPSGNLQGYFNGSAVGTPAALGALTWANIATAIAEAPFLGCRNNGGTPGSFTACTIKALLIYNRPLTATELTQVHRYLGSRYSISVP